MSNIIFLKGDRNMKIIVKLWGGIGNQLFQFVFGQYLRYRYGLDVYYDNNSYISVDHLRKGEVDFLDFKIKYDNSCTFSKYRGIKNRLLRYFFQADPRHHFITENSDLPSSYKNGHLYYFQGYWQNYKYYDWMTRNVSSFEIKSKIIPVELEPYRVLISKCEESVSLHVRRGDYFSPENIKVYGVCDEHYYMNAVSKITDMLGTPHFFVFTDDPDWVIENIELDERFTLIKNYDISQFAYIELMSMCKHHIISNSSFSWWGTVLDEGKDSIVISPEKWTNINSPDMILESWIKLR